MHEDNTTCEDCKQARKEVCLCVCVLIKGCRESIQTTEYDVCMVFLWSSRRLGFLPHFKDCMWGERKTVLPVGVNVCSYVC